MNEQEYREDMKQKQLQEKADRLFAACLQFLIAREEQFLVAIRDLSQDLLNQGYETRFEHRKRALIVRSAFQQFTVHLAPEEVQDRVLPRQQDLRSLPDAS